MLIDFRIGGKVVSMTEATLDGYGVSERTGRARDRGYVMREGIKFSNVKAYYDVVGATSFNSVYNVEDYVYDATNVRMREISLGYTFRNLFGQSKNLTLAFNRPQPFLLLQRRPDGSRRVDGYGQRPARLRCLQPADHAQLRSERETEFLIKSVYTL